MQTTNTIMLVRPANFTFNAETAGSNAFQNKIAGSPEEIEKQVLAEFDNFAKTLKARGVNVLVIEDTKHPIKPDAIFPNNWITTHTNGKAILYPMMSANRQYERRPEILETLNEKFELKEVVDFSKYEKENRFLEGTGSMIFDHPNQIAYACLSPRTDKDLFVEVCNYLDYKPVSFTSQDKSGKDIYHTNVMMCIGSKIAIICLESITNPSEQTQVIERLETTGHRVIAISFEQMNRFAGNMLEVKTNGKKDTLVMSQSAFDSLNPNQIKDIEEYCELLPINIKTIETIGGGSVRCMMAQIFLKPK